MKTLFTAVILAASLAAAGSASAQTLGDSLADGRMSSAAFNQLIAGTGVSADEARGLTLSDIGLLRTDANDDTN